MIVQFDQTWLNEHWFVLQRLCPVTVCLGPEWNKLFPTVGANPLWIIPQGLFYQSRDTRQAQIFDRHPKNNLYSYWVLIFLCRKSSRDATKTPI